MRALAAVWGAVSLALLVVAVIASAGGGYAHAQQVANTRTHFYRVVLGKDPADAPTVVNKLGVDFRQAFKREGPKAIATFRGDPNLYGGIDEALDLKVFTDTGCRGCGSFTDPMVKRLVTVEGGQINEMITSERPHRKSAGFFWVLTTLVMLSGPLVFGAIYLRRELRRKREYPEETYLIEQLGGLIDSAQSVDRRELVALRDSLERIRDGDKNSRARSIVEQARIQVKARAEADRELEP